jgi:hypothetical protein
MNGWSLADALRVFSQKSVAPPLLLADSGVNVLGNGFAATRATAKAPRGWRLVTGTFLRSPRRRRDQAFGSSPVVNSQPGSGASSADDSRQSPRRKF